MSKKLTYEELELKVRTLEKEVLVLKETHNSFKEAEDRYRIFIEQSAEGIWCFESELPIPINLPVDDQIELYYKWGYLSECNDMMAKMYGFSSKKEIIGARLGDLLIRSDPDNIEYLRSFVNAGYRLTDAESHELDREGKPLIFLNNLIGVIENGKLLRAWGTQRDISERKRAEDVLAESVRKYRLLANNLTDVIWSLDMDLKFTYISPSVKKLRGYTPEEAVKVSLEQTFTPASYHKVAQTFAEEMDRDGQPGVLPDRSVFLELDTIHKDGDVIPVEVSASFLRDENCSPIGIIGVTRDITDRKRAEAALRESEEKYRGIFDESIAAVYVFNNKKEFIDTNQAGIDLLGYSREELLSMSIPDVDVDPIVVLPAHKQLLGGERIINYEHQLKKKDGKVITVLNNSRPITDADGNVIGMQSTLIDITARKQAEKALQESEKRFRELAELLPETIYEMDAGGNLTFVNRSAFDQFRYVQQDFDRSLNAFQMIIPEDRDRALENVNKILRGENVGLQEYTALRKDGSTFPALFHSTAIFCDQIPVGLRGFIIDITEKKQLESQLQQSYKMESIGTLASGIAHDFNNILSAIMGYTELALDSVERETQLYENLQEVLHAGNRARDLVKQILTFSRQDEQVHKPVKVKLIVNEALKFLRSSLPTTIEIHHDIRCDSLVLGDPTQIHQILMNLCTNAEHSMRENGGELEVKLADVELDADLTTDHPDMKPGTYVNLTVRDTGHGIPSHVLDRVFDPFFTTKKIGEGTGMGLSVVHGIVGSYGGTITVFSEPGQGSTFNVYFPAIERILKSEPAVEEPIATGKERVLFVDDEPALAEIGKQTLESLGYDVTTRTSSIEALELFKGQPDRFDLVITDMTMPNMTGDDLTRELISIKPDIPVILCTGFSAKIDDQKAKEMGIRAFVLKPIVKREIAKTVRKVLDVK